MNIRDDYGITEIEQTGVEEFDISWDTEHREKADGKLEEFRSAATFFVRFGGDHKHIQLSRKGAETLRDWLNAYLALPEEEIIRSRNERELP